MFCSDKIAKEVVEKHYGKPIYKIQMMVESEYQKYQSDLLFAGDLIQMYPNIKVQKAKKPITCDFSGALITPGNLYVNFRPLFKNIINGDTYVLKRTIKTELGYEKDIPQTIQELENFYYRALSERPDERYINYNHFMSSMGGVLSFQKLKRRKKNEDCNS